MIPSDRPCRVFAPVITPFDAALRPDPARLIAHCRWLLDHHVGLAIFGTNSEANSLSLAEKLTLLDQLIEAGLPPASMMPGTGCCALTETAQLTRHAVAAGCTEILMLPPFYYKKVSDDGLFRYFAEIIERVGDARLRIYLYHIPALSQIPISLALISRLLHAYPDIIAGIKDSSGDWNNMAAMLREFQPEGFDVFSGSETFLLATCRAGGAGCISAVANVNPAQMAHLARHWRDSEADGQQQELTAIRKIFDPYPLIAALKTTLAHHAGDPQWDRLRPPLTSLSQAEKDRLITQLTDRHFTMPRLTAPIPA